MNELGVEATILRLAEEIAKGLNCLEADLNKVLKRGVEEKDSDEMRARNPSIVGEIIEVLEHNGLRLTYISDMIRTQILSKL